ncbi:MAG: hypothetical protein JXJ04_18985 [Spirochaetales bacterium]|nr:hypothetical protein [Spirochaetales bacterium]
MFKALKNRMLLCKLKNKKDYVFAVLLPLLFGLFPLLFLYANNAKEMMIHDLFIPLLQVLIFTLVVTTIVGLILKNFFKSGLITAFLLFSYFSSGHFLRILPEIQIPIGSIIILTGHVLFIIWLAITVTGSIFIVRTKGNLFPIIQILLTIGTFLVLFQVVQAGSILISRKNVLAAEEIPIKEIIQKKDLPDVYYIVTDAYGSSEILSEIYGVDNSQFITFLKSKGFYVPEKSYSHYCQTIFSLGAVLNMNYIDALGDFDPSLTDRIPISQKLRNNEVVKYFKAAGYSICGFDTGYSHTILENTDVLFKPSGTVSEFENVLLSTTILPVAQSDENSLFAKHRKRVLYILDKIPNITETESPRFVFAHIISPHPPFIFNEKGEPIEQSDSFHFGDGSHYMNSKGGSRENYYRGYSGQVTYITKLLKIMIERIFERYTENKPVIIIQGDHGPGSGLKWGSLEETNIKERFSILHTYYLPDHEGNPAYNAITPINMFRVIFNTYLDARFPLLPRKNYFTLWALPYDFKDVTQLLPPGEDTAPLKQKQ